MAPAFGGEVDMDLDADVDANMPLKKTKKTPKTTEVGAILDKWASPEEESRASCSAFFSLASLSSGFMSPVTIRFPYLPKPSCACMATVLGLGDKGLLAVHSSGLLGGPPAAYASWPSTRS